MSDSEQPKKSWIDAIMEAYQADPEGYMARFYASNPDHFNPDGTLKKPRIRPEDVIDLKKINRPIPQSISIHDVVVDTWLPFFLYLTECNRILAQHARVDLPTYAEFNEKREINKLTDMFGDLEPPAEPES